MEKDSVIILDLQPYCMNGCEDLEPEAISYYANNDIYRQFIKCKNREHCEKVAKVISKFYERRSEEK